MSGLDRATAVGGVLAKGAQNAGGLEQANKQMGDNASAFDVWTHSYDGMSQRMRDFAEDPAGALASHDRDLNNAVEAGLTGDWHSSSFSAVGDSIAAQAAGLGDMVDAIGKAEGALATVGATFALLTGVEQMLSTLVSVIPFPALPAIRIMDMDVGLPHAHSHPPNLVPPAPPVPLPSTGPIIPIPILSGAARTLINGMPAARCGDMGLGIWCGGYFPMYEVFLGSSSVWIEGARAGRLAVDITKHCIFTVPKPSDPPLGPMVGVTIMASGNVLIGGVPMPSLLSLAMAGAMKGLMKGLGKVGRVLERSTRAARQRLARNMKPGFLKCRVLRAEPVDVVTGEVVVDQQDFAIPGRIPISWDRHYGSKSERKGVCGHGWETPADARLVFEDDGSVTFYDGTAAPTLFPVVPFRQPVMELVDGALLERLGGFYVVKTKPGLHYYFPAVAGALQEIPLSHVQDLHGNWLRFVRDENGLRRIEESAGRVIEIQSVAGLVRRIHLWHPDDNSVHSLVGFEYDAAANLIAVYDALGAPYRFAYAGHQLIQHTDRNGLSFYYEYDKPSALGRCVHTWGDGGLYDYHLTYHDQDRRTAIVDSLQHLWQVQYDYRFHIIEEVDPLGGVFAYEYDEAGRTTVVKDPDGNQTVYEYDERGNLVSLTQPDGRTTSTEFNATNQPVRITDPAGAVWHQEWSHGRPVRQITPLGAKSEYEYDTHGQLVAFTNPRNACTYFSFDSIGNVTALKDALGRATRFTYGALGGVASKIDPLGQLTRYVYDLEGRLSQVVFPGGSAVSCAYDAEGNLVQYTDENSLITRLEYFGLGEVRRRLQADGHTVEYHYDTEERLTGITNQRGEHHAFIRDPLGRVIEEIDYWGQARRYSYTSSGHLKESTDPLGRFIRYETDAVGRILKKIVPDSGGTDAPQTEAFEYDRSGNMTACENASIRIERAFDLEGRLVQERQGDAVTVSYAYDANGNCLTRTVEHTLHAQTYSNRVGYHYDLLDQSIGVEAGGYTMRFTRNAVGQITRESLGGVLDRDLSYHPDGYLTGQRVVAGGRPLFEQKYRYDGAGNMIAKYDSLSGVERYLYDPLSRLVAQLDPEGRLRRILNDPVGDRLGTGSHDASGDSDWRRQGEYNGTTYRFDRAGSLIERAGLGAMLHLSWDVHQRLSESRTNGRTTTYQYDPLGRRLSKQTAGIVTHFLWDGDALLGDVDLASRRAASPTAQTREWVYYPGTFEPLVLVQRRADSFDDALYFYHNDPNGCPARLFDREGRIAWAARYGPWGEIDRSHSGRLDNPLRLQGQYADSETGLCYNRNRYYDASIGTFVSQDPLGLEPSENPYQYAQNVHAWIDPLGLACARPRSPHPIGRRFRFSTMKAAREAAERASPFGRAVKHIDPKHGPHFHPADDLGRPLNHDHYFFPKRFT